MKGFWLYAIKHAAFVQNRCPSRSLSNNGIPFQFWSGKEVNYSMFLLSDLFDQDRDLRTRPRSNHI